MLQALDVTVTAAPDRAVISGTIPVGTRLPDSISGNEILTIVRTSACVFETDQVLVPVLIEFSLPTQRERN